MKLTLHRNIGMIDKIFISFNGEKLIPIIQSVGYCRNAHGMFTWNDDAYILIMRNVKCHMPSFVFSQFTTKSICINYRAGYRNDIFVYTYT